MDINANKDVLKRINDMNSILKHECPVSFEMTEINGGIISKCEHIYFVLNVYRSYYKRNQNVQFVVVFLKGNVLFRLNPCQNQQN